MQRRRPHRAAFVICARCWPRSEFPAQRHRRGLVAVARTELSAVAHRQRGAARQVAVQASSTSAALRAMGAPVTENESPPAKAMVVLGCTSPKVCRQPRPARSAALIEPSMMSWRRAGPAWWWSGRCAGSGRTGPRSRPIRRSHGCAGRSRSGPRTVPASARRDAHGVTQLGEQLRGAGAVSACSFCVPPPIRTMRSVLRSCQVQAPPARKFSLPAPASKDLPAYRVRL